MKDAPASLAKLQWIMAELRNPETGCPWDLKQSFASIVPHTIEEAYEVADAIEQNNFNELPKELGDLLFQVVFYSQLAKEESLFTMDDVIAAMCEKLIRRHPHVFGGVDFDDEAAIKANWENEKQKEREQNLQAKSILDDIPNVLPALSQAQKIQKRCAHVGFDWPDIHQVLEKIEEEVDEVKAELEAPILDNDALGEELGDLLFATVNLCRHAKKDPEQLLRQANKKFSTRFKFIEEQLQAQGKDFSDTDLDYLESLWQKAKVKVKEQAK